MYKHWQICGEKSPSQCLQEIEDEQLSESSNPRSFSSHKRKSYRKSSDYEGVKQKKSLKSCSKKQWFKSKLGKRTLELRPTLGAPLKVANQWQPPLQNPVQPSIILPKPHLKQPVQCHTEVCESYGLQAPQKLRPTTYQDKPSNKGYIQQNQFIESPTNMFTSFKNERPDKVVFNQKKFLFHQPKVLSNPEIYDPVKKCQSHIKFSYFQHTSCSEKSSFLTKFGETEPKPQNRETLLKETKSVKNLRNFEFIQTQSIADSQEKSEVSIVVEDPFPNLRLMNLQKFYSAGGIPNEKNSQISSHSPLSEQMSSFIDQASQLKQ